MYHNYVADTLRYIVNNTAEQEKRMVINKSYSELLDYNKPQKKKREEEQDANKQAEAIISHMKGLLGGT